MTCESESLWSRSGMPPVRGKARRSRWVFAVGSGRRMRRLFRSSTDEDAAACVAPKDVRLTVAVEKAGSAAGNAGAEVSPVSVEPPDCVLVVGSQSGPTLDDGAHESGAVCSSSAKGNIETREPSVSSKTLPERPDSGRTGPRPVRVLDTRPVAFRARRDYPGSNLSPTRNLK